MTGLLYVVSYSGFALPFVLNTYEDRIGPSAPLVVLAVLAVLTAVARLVAVVRSGTQQQRRSTGPPDGHATVGSGHLEDVRNPRSAFVSTGETR